MYRRRSPHSKFDPTHDGQSCAIANTYMVMNSTSNYLNTALILNGKVRVKIERREKSTEK